jgi:coproporphyrinogen III oxidase-like Fe-S oxidoreductase
MEFEAIPAKVSAFETVMMGLRTARGVDSVRFARRFGSRPELLFPSSIGKWGGLFELSEKSIRLDGRGMDILNSILVDIGTEIDSAPDFRIGGNA